MDEIEEIQGDEYVVGSPNTSYLISSLELMLREDKYLSLYDTSILSLPEEHLKKYSFEKLNQELLYKWLSFFAGIERIFQSNNNLVITPEVGEEMQNLIAGTLSAIDKRKIQFKTYSSQQKETFQRLFEHLHKNEEILIRIQDQLSKYRIKTTLTMPTVFNYFLEFIKMLDSLLDLKKPSSRKSNDTDERICARAFYEMAVNGYNIAVYTRDEDIRKLISATYKFLTSKQIKEESSFSFLQNFSHLNIVVLKYHYEKRVFSRFFESSTDAWGGDFRFSPKLATKSKGIYEDTKAILQEIENHLQIAASSSQNESVPMNIPNPSISQEKVNKTVETLFKTICKIQIQDNIPNHRLKIDLLKHISILADAIQQSSLQEEILEMKKKAEENCIQNLISQLKQDQVELEKKFEQISKLQPTPGIEYWQNIKTSAEASAENLHKLYFFENALRLNLCSLAESDYQRYKEFLERFRQIGIIIDQSETPIQQEKIAEIAQLSITETIQIIERYKIKYQSMHVYLSQSSLLYFLVRL